MKKIEIEIEDDVYEGIQKIEEATDLRIKDVLRDETVHFYTDKLNNDGKLEIRKAKLLPSEFERNVAKREKREPSPARDCVVFGFKNILGKSYYAVYCDGVEMDVPSSEVQF